MSEINLNEEVEMVVEDASVITTPIDDTLTISGDAADAKAVGDALALKADRSELQNAITVNGQSADAQGAILIDGDEIPVDEAVARTALRTRRLAKKQRTWWRHQAQVEWVRGPADEADVPRAAREVRSLWRKHGKSTLAI